MKNESPEFLNFHGMAPGTVQVTYFDDSKPGTVIASGPDLDEESDPRLGWINIPLRTALFAAAKDTLRRPLHYLKHLILCH